MNRLLPKIKDLEPINNPVVTFCETPFTKEFGKLDEKDQLQVITDIVKQTMLYDEIPDPETESFLIGDDYTAAKVLMKYLKSLNIFPKVELFLVTNRKNIDLKNHYDCHFSLIVTGKSGKEYLVDATPDIGYGIGEANDLSKNDLYNHYVHIDKDIEYLIEILRKDMYDIDRGIYTARQIEHYKSIKKLFNNEYFNGLLANYYNCIHDSDYRTLKRFISIDFHDRMMELNRTKDMNKIRKLVNLNSWYEILQKSLATSNDYKEQQRLAQYITKETNQKRYMSIDGIDVEINHITPRLLWELGYNVAIIKSSAYLAGIQASCENHMIPDRRKIKHTYLLDSKNSLGLRTMAYFHPHGIEYEYQMAGPNKIILVDENAKELNKRKHEIRDTMVQKIQNHFVTWFNGEKVQWDTQLKTNFVHATDDATEASVHILLGYPEYQAFTRFNYPSPVLRKEKKNERRI